MGDMADDVEVLSNSYEDILEDLEESYYEMQEELSERKENKRTERHKKQWRMNNGEFIRICDMTDSHLENTIRFIENNFLNRS